MTARRALFAVFSTTLLLGLAWGCAAVDTGDDFSAGNGGQNGIREAGNDEATFSPAGSGQTENNLVLNPLCGKSLKGCVPDVVASCRRYVPPVVPTDDDAGLGSDASLLVQAGASGGAGGVATPNAGAGGDGGTSGASGARGEGGEGGAPGAPVQNNQAGQAGAAGEGGSAGAPPVAAPQFGCQVVRVPDAPHTVVSECAVVGPGGANEPCLTSSDCRAGFGCVGDQNSGLCQQYCCKDGEQCQPRTYCAERPLRDAITNAPPPGSTAASNSLSIPVCVPAENCDLSLPYPCLVGTQCACKPGTACLVVRADGTTTCAAPGAGKAGDACAQHVSDVGAPAPCAWGHVCSAAKNQCLKLCSTRAAPSCGDGQCQSASELPEGWGVCVGSTPTGG